MSKELASVLRGKIKKLDESCKGIIPDFLIISSSKTGTTWLWRVLSHCKNDIFLPRFFKELNYFCIDERITDIPLTEYLDFFIEGEGRLKGEASPSYVILPESVIREIKRLNPRMKLIFLMREPVNRAWSHSKHMIKFHEVGSVVLSGDLQFDHDLFTEAFYNDFNVSSGDYESILTRWISVFGRDAVYIDFFENIAAAPELLLKNVLNFLGLKDFDGLLSPALLEKNYFKGADAELPAYFKFFMNLVCHGRSLKLVDYLTRELQLPSGLLPEEWKKKTKEKPFQQHNAVEYKGYYLFNYSSKSYAALKLDYSSACREKLTSFQNIKNKFFEGDSFESLKNVIDKARLSGEALKYISPYEITRELYKSKYGKAYEKEKKITIDGIVNLNHIFFIKMHALWVWRFLVESYGRLALFGAGRHTAWLLNLLKQENLKMPVFILDDYYSGKDLDGVPVFKPEEVNKDFDAIILSTDTHQRVFKRRLKEVMPNEKPIDIYSGFPRGPYLLY